MLKELNEKILDLSRYEPDMIEDQLEAYTDCKVMLESVINKIDGLEPIHFIADSEDWYAFGKAIEKVIEILKGENND